MSTAQTTLRNLSDSLAASVDTSISGVVAVRAAAYRVSSGVAIRPDLIAVADHTLKRSDRIPVQTADGRNASATLLGRDPTVDVAILKVSDLTLTPLPSASPDTLKAGMLVTVVGLTMDAGPSVSLGMLGAVSGPRRTWRSGVLDRFIRLDVNLYPSQSGAAVVNCEGQFVGLATPGLLRHSAVAVPLATIDKVAEELVKQGRIRQGYLGVGVQPVAIPESLRAKIGDDQTSGLIVLTVETQSPAEQGSLQIGDILVSLDGKPLADVDDLHQALRGEIVGKRSELLILRGGEALRREIEISERARKSDPQ
ncbi:MAG: serine protease [Acidobacteriaceae bacterium]|nr:serine protease [Acidobacteriaceae bacterium]